MIVQNDRAKNLHYHFALSFFRPGVPGVAQFWLNSCSMVGQFWLEAGGGQWDSERNDLQFLNQLEPRRVYLGLGC